MDFKVVNTMYRVVENEKEITSQIIKILAENNLSCKQAEELLRYVVSPEITKNSYIKIS